MRNLESENLEDYADYLMRERCLNANNNQIHAFGSDIDFLASNVTEPAASDEQQLASRGANEDNLWLLYLKAQQVPGKQYTGSLPEQPFNDAVDFSSLGWATDVIAADEYLHSPLKGPSSDNLHSEERSFLLDEIMQDFTEDGVLTDEEVNKGSFKYALQFLSNLPDNFSVPTYDVHPDGEFSYVWRNNNAGILAISFSEDGMINYASYSPRNNARSKGEVSFSRLNFKNPEDDKASEENIILFSLIGRFS